MIKEVSSLEGLSDLDALRDYMVNQKMKVEISNEEIKRLMGQIRQQEDRLEEVREMHKMESSSQSDLIDKLRQQLTESEALLKVAESDSTAQKTDLSQHEAEIERLKGLLKDEEEKRAKAITLLKTVRQKLTKAEKERDDIAKEREKDREDISAARAEIERVRADAERAKKERERDIAAMRDRFEKEIKETRERHEKESTARKGQYELDIITMKACPANYHSTSGKLIRN
ncbi:vesicle-mediated transport [Ceratobasidium sp. AG-Ba]|nr:vesicle-mediated transport [Ceratobasidium sp. AG-Ba]